MVNKHPESSDTIRSDVVKLITLDDDNFTKWYNKRKNATERLLKDYEIFSSIPNLNYEEGNDDMTANTSVKEHLTTLKEGLEHLKLIRQIREKYKSD
jgi:hypothetical protein